TQNQRYGSSHIGATAKDISNVVTDAASGVVDIFHGIDKAVAKHWGLRKSRNATSLNSRFKSLDTLKVKIISVTFRRVIRTNHKKASKIWRHENIQLGGCQS